MEAEVNRVLVLTRNSLLPVSWIPARKNYKEFHEDLFPPTRGRLPVCDADAWRRGNADIPADEALKPGKNKTTTTTTTTTTTPKKSHENNHDQNGNAQNATEAADTTPVKSTPTSAPSHSNDNQTPSNPLRTSATPKPSPLAGLFVSKFKHVKMDLGKKLCPTVLEARG